MTFSAPRAADNSADQAAVDDISVVCAFAYNAVYRHMPGDPAKEAGFR